MSGVRKSFGATEVLKGISAAAAGGEVVSIIGSSGSGKSTLLRCANLLEVPDAGSVSIRGEPFRMVSGAKGRRIADPKQVARLRSRIGMVFQNFNLWGHKTILENLVEAPIHVQKRKRQDCLDEAAHFLEKVGIAEKRHAYPAQLSGGQQQRAAIARALALHPDLLLFDEPTSALDPELVGEVLRVMRSLAQEGRTMLIVTHEMAFARDVSSKIIFLNQGLIEEEGSPSEIFRRDRSDRLNQFLAMQPRNQGE